MLKPPAMAAWSKQQTFLAVVHPPVPDFLVILNLKNAWICEMCTLQYKIITLNLDLSRSASGEDVRTGAMRQSIELPYIFVLIDDFKMFLLVISCVNTMISFPFTLQLQHPLHPLQPLTGVHYACTHKITHCNGRTRTRLLRIARWSGNIIKLFHSKLATSEQTCTIPAERALLFFLVQQIFAWSQILCSNVPWCPPKSVDSIQFQVSVQWNLFLFPSQTIMAHHECRLSDVAFSVMITVLENVIPSSSVSSTSAILLSRSWPRASITRLRMTDSTGWPFKPERPK